MEMAFDGYAMPRILLSVIGTVLCIGPMVADFNATHATNPLWTGHARFHVVWQVSSNSALMVLLLVLLWVPVVDYLYQLWLVVTVQAIVLLGFYATLLSMRLFGGTLSDPNGIPPLRFSLFGLKFKVDSNLFFFSLVMIVLLVAASMLI